MSYTSVFNHPSTIAFGVTTIIVILSIVGFSIAQIYCKKLAIINKRRLNGICLITGMIIGICMASTNHFQIFHENNNDAIYRDDVYYIAGLANLCISILLLGFLIFIPIKTVLNVNRFSHYENWKNKLLKFSFIYLFYGALAIGVSMLMYPLSFTFLSEKTSSDFSFASTPLSTKIWSQDHTTLITKPTIYVIGSYLLINLLQVKNPYFTLAFFIYLIVNFIIAIIVTKCKKTHQWNQSFHHMEKANVIIDKVLSVISTIFTFIAIIACIMVQPLGTVLRFCLILILVTILFLCIFSSNVFWVWCHRGIKTKEFFIQSKEAFVIVLKEPLQKDFIQCLKKNHRLNCYESKQEEQMFYTIFITAIYSIIIVAYLGFSAGPLHSGYLNYVNADNEVIHKPFHLWQHVIFWISLYIIGYGLSFLYSFQHDDGADFRMMLSGAAPFIHSGYNTGILNYFNTYIDKLAMFSSYTTFISIKSKSNKLKC